MVGKSDIVILGVASALLIGGLLRWQQSLPESGLQTMASTGSAMSTAAHNTAEQTQANAAVIPSTQITTSTASTATLPTPSVNLSSTAAVETQSSPPQELQGKTVIVEASAQGDSFTSDRLATQSALLVVHRVKSGEYLSLLAKRYNSSVEELVDLNGLTSTTLQIGQEIIYPSNQ